MKHIRKLLKSPKDGSPSRGSPSRPETPWPNNSVGGTTPRAGSPVAVSALVSSPLVPVPSSPHIEPAQTKTTGTSKNNWKNLDAFLEALKRSSAFSPLVSAIEDLSWFIRTYESASTTRTEYDALRIKLEGLFTNLRVHFVGNTPPEMTSSITNLCEAIQIELREVYGTKDRNVISRYLQAEQDLDKIVGCYRRIEDHLERVMMNASLNTWRIVDGQAADAKLDRLKPSMSACYDSGQANVVQRRQCAAKTREKVISDLEAWKNKREGERVYWINGMAGTGKTTIATTLCSTLDKRHELGASFFCTRSLPECRDVKLILPTIAYQLARFSQPFRGALLQVLERDTDVHTKLPQVQLRRMILEPLQSVARSLPNNIVVVIDALDECEGGDEVGQILQVLLENASVLPIKFLVSSRPEYHIRQKIRESKLESQLVLHDLDEKMVEADIATYLRAELAGLSVPVTEEQISTLVQRAGALFIYAATAIRYIRGGDSLDRLDSILKASSTGQGTSNQTKEIDLLYEIVLKSAFNNDMEEAERNRMQLVLHAVVCAQEPLTVCALAGLLNLTSARVNAALKPLWSILRVSNSDVEDRVSTLHASFPDYMLNSSRSGSFACNVNAHNATLAKLCFERIERHIPQFNICNLPSSYLFDTEVTGIDEDVKRHVPLDLLYACQYWAAHLELGAWKNQEDQVDSLHGFLSERLLLWMEVLNLTGRIDKGVIQVNKATSWLQTKHHHENTMLLARDARRFVTLFATSPVSKSTPHIYVSMLASWPPAQPIAHCYTHRSAGLVLVKGLEATERQLSLLTMTPAGSQVRCVACSPNGAYITAGTADKRVLIWDAVTCQLTIDPIQAHTNAVTAIAISPDSTQVCSASNDWTICVWDIQSGAGIAGPLKAHSSRVWSVDYSPDGRWLSSGSYDGTVCIWSTSDWRMKGEPLGNRGKRVVSVAFSPSGTLLAAASESDIYLWDPFAGQIISGPLKGHTDLICTLTFLPDERHIVSGSEDCTICVWDVTHAKLVAGPLRGHSETVEAVAVSPDGGLLVSASEDGTMRTWNTSTWQTHSVFRHTGLVRSVRFLPDGSRLVSGSADGNMRIWEVPDAPIGQDMYGQSPAHESWVSCVSFSPCGSYLVSGSHDLTVRVWNMQAGQPTCTTLTGHNAYVLSVGFSLDSSHIYSVSRDRMVHVWERQSGKLEYMIGPIDTDGDYDPWYQEFWPAVLIYDDNRVVCGSSSGRIYVWKDGKQTHELTGHDEAVYSIAVSPDGRTFASGDDGGKLMMWDGSTGAQLRSISEAHADCIYSIAYSHDGALLASGSRDMTIRLWNPHTGQPIGDRLRGHSDTVRCVAFSSQGDKLASGSSDRTIRIWDVESRTSIAVLEGHTGYVLSVMFSPNGACVVSGSADTTIRVWHTHTSSSVHDIQQSQGLNWKIDKDGWVRDSHDHLLFWVPPDLRGALLMPQNTMLMSRQCKAELELTNAKIGNEWEACYRPL
ncbi:WD40 repeat-like protein [Rhizoctonia solani]|uniref:WD40 repeat-like protein n=1 Tax=Rhizoctonia solani TaxID=456999 RepID=A0A8H7LIU1_9AGAM|nr:WD40 repeat-like protein [Rhizoctonia solani]